MDLYRHMRGISLHPISLQLLYFHFFMIERVCFRLKVEVGLTEDGTYSPVDIHGLNIYSSIVSADRVDPDSCSPGDEPGDLASWIDFEVCSGVVGNIIAPSACHTHTSQCAPGFRGADCSIEIGKATSLLHLESHEKQRHC